MIEYLSMDVNPVPLDVKILMKNEGLFNDMAQVITMSSKEWSQEDANEWLLGNGLTLWAAV